MAKMFKDYNYDYDTELKDQETRQKLLDALQLAALKGDNIPAPGQSGQFTVASKISPWAGVSKIAEALLLRKQAADLKAEKSDFLTQTNEDLKTGLTDFYTNSQTDKQKALIEALASKHPILRQLAMAQMEQQAKAGGLDIVQIDPDKIPIDKASGKVFTPAVDANTQPGTLTGVSEDGMSGPGWKMIRDERGNLVKMTSFGPSMVDKAPRTNVNVALSPVTKGEGKFMEEVGTQNAKSVIDATKRKQNAEQSLFTANKLEQLDAQGIFSGPTANVATVLASFADTVGLPVNQTKLANSEAYQAELGRRVAEVLTAGAGVGRSMTDADREAFMRQFPQQIASPEGRKAIINEMRKNAVEDFKYSRMVLENAKRAYPEASNLLEVNASSTDYPVGEGGGGGLPQDVEIHNW